MSKNLYKSKTFVYFCITRNNSQKFFSALVNNLVCKALLLQTLIRVLIKDQIYDDTLGIQKTVSSDIMSATRKNNWRTIPIPNTTIQIRKYLEACQNWLMQTQEEETCSNECMYNHPWKFNDHTTKQTLGLLENEIQTIKKASCSICETVTEDWKISVGNPFTHAQFMILCPKCHSGCS